MSARDTQSTSTLLQDRLAEAAALAQSLADDTEASRRLPADLVRALRAAGIFRLCVPQRLGGLEADVATLLRCIETIAGADGSAGWCAMIGATSGIVTAYLTDEAAQGLAIGADTIFGGVFAPYGRATVVDGGYRLSGRWPFASGCQHCTWLMGGALIVEGDRPRTLAGGQPDSRMLLFPAAEAEIIDTWNVSGLRGTGSHDVAVHDRLIPRLRSVSLMTDAPKHTGRLYLFPVFGMLALGIAAVALGIARRAIDELIDLAGRKRPTGSRRLLAERSAVQSQVAEAEAALRSVRAFLFESVAQAWETAGASGAIEARQRALLRLAATHATTTAATVVTSMYSAGGGSSIYATSPLQRCFRDVHVATQHVMVAPPTYELAGRVFLGLETDISQL